MDHNKPNSVSQVADSPIAAQQRKLLKQASRDSRLLGHVFGQHRDRLKRIVNAGLDQRVRVRMDASDVVQETFLEAFARINDYVEAPKVSLFVWLRFLAKQRLAMLHRQHLHVQARDARRELPLEWVVEGHGSRLQLAAQLAATLTTASVALARKEIKREIQLALDRLDDKSCEVLMLRHFEQLSNAESAEVLQISPTAACNRYIRALERLKKLLDSPPDPEP